ncbi:hypothetical protein L1987_10977 [Smallanthus sonchifolius]|uniref:Uncharacterized protein n=1 Tax=Smallanthus sonchifolius TaxID=185202 RepID=A0ACB9JBX0_9ASTR|nr:hypothetical protein L1987_10977 [Smallanthus sonchifolius]
MQFSMVFLSPFFDLNAANISSVREHTGFYVGRFVGGDRSSIEALFSFCSVFHLLCSLLVLSAGCSPLFPNCFDAFEAKKGLFWRRVFRWVSYKSVV